MKRLLIASSAFFVLLLVLLSSVGGQESFAKDHDVTPTPTVAPLKVTICHYDNGQGGKYTSNDININSVNDCQNASGHDAHSSDIIPSYTYGTCTYAGKNLSKVSWIANNCSQPVTPTPTQGVTPTPTQGVTPTPTQGVTPTPTVICNEDHDCVPTATPTVVPTSEVTPTTPPSPHGDGLSDGRSSCPECTQAPHNTQAVLGAETMAATGTFDTDVMNFVLLGGMLSMGAAAYAKAKKA